MINLNVLHIARIQNIINQQRFIILSDVCNLLAIVFVLTVQYFSRFLKNLRLWSWSKGWCVHCCVRWLISAALRLTIKKILKIIKLNPEFSETSAGPRLWKLSLDFLNNEAWLVFLRSVNIKAPIAQLLLRSLVSRMLWTKPFGQVALLSFLSLQSAGAVFRDHSAGQTLIPPPKTQRFLLQWNPAHMGGAGGAEGEDCPGQQLCSDLTPLLGLSCALGRGGSWAFAPQLLGKQTLAWQSPGVHGLSVLHLTWASRAVGWVP